MRDTSQSTNINLCIQPHSAVTGNISEKMKHKVLVLLTTIAVAQSYIVTDRHRPGPEDDRWRMTPLGSLEDRIRISPPEPARLMVRAGENVTLSCEASHPWFLCLWVHPKVKMRRKKI